MDSIYFLLIWFWVWFYLCHNYGLLFFHIYVILEALFNKKAPGNVDFNEWKCSWKFSKSRQSTIQITIGSEA